MVVNYINPRVRKTQPLTFERVRELLDYDPVSGRFAWKTGGLNRVAGKEPGSNCNGYRVIGIDGRRYRANRLAMFWTNSEWPSGHVDHRDGNKSRDCASNRREATPQMNQANAKMPKNNTSGFKGVCWSRPANRWRAYLTVNRKQIHLGFFDDPKDAAVAYNLAATSRFGSFAKLNQV